MATKMAVSTRNCHLSAPFSLFVTHFRRFLDSLAPAADFVVITNLLRPNIFAAQDRKAFFMRPASKSRIRPTLIIAASLLPAMITVAAHGAVTGKPLPDKAPEPAPKGEEHGAAAIVTAAGITTASVVSAIITASVATAGIAASGIATAIITAGIATAAGITATSVSGRTFVVVVVIRRSCGRAG